MTPPGAERDAGLTASYDIRGVSVLRGLIEPARAGELAGLITRHPRRLVVAAGAELAGSVELYGAPEFDALLLELKDQVEARIGRQLLPTYSFARVYFAGQPLILHRDRPACEHSLSLHLAAAFPEPWPLWARTLDGQRLAVDLQPGDALVYEGTRVQHWRGRCPVDWYAQVFLHFVDAHGPHAAEHLDRRRALGEPSVRGVAP